MVDTLYQAGDQSQARVVHIPALGKQEVEASSLEASGGAKHVTAGAPRERHLRLSLRTFVACQLGSLDSIRSTSVYLHQPVCLEETSGMGSDHLPRRLSRLWGDPSQLRGDGASPTRDPSRSLAAGLPRRRGKPHTELSVANL